MPDVWHAVALRARKSAVTRGEWLELLAGLNDELRQRGAAPTYNVGAIDELFTDAEVRQAVGQTLRDVMALREWS